MPKDLGWCSAGSGAQGGLAVTRLLWVVEVCRLPQCPVRPGLLLLAECCVLASSVSVSLARSFSLGTGLRLRRRVLVDEGACVH